MEMQHFSGRVRSKRSLLAFGGLLLSVSVFISVLPAMATDSNLTSAQVAAEIIRVQNNADRTAKAWAEAQIRQEELAGELVVAQNNVDQKSAEFAQIQTQLSNLAVDRYMGGSGTSILFFEDPVDQLQTKALSAVALNQGAADLDSVETVRADLEADKARLLALQDENKRLSDQMASHRAELDVRLEQLKKLKTHLVDEETKRAYEQQLAKQRAQEEQARLKAEQDAAKAAMQAAAKKAAAVPVVQSGGRATPAPTKPAATPTPQAPEPGGAGSGAEPPANDPVAPEPAPVPAPAPVITGGDWLCPVAGPNAFGDTWGAPRSGGRSHEGVDMMSPAGTPLVAVVAGSATMKQNALGGNVVWLTGSDGNKYYYAHLSAWEGGSRAVSAGEVIGYVGRTGNTSANHLHFGINLAGGMAINPYPIVRKYC